MLEWTSVTLQQTSTDPACAPDGPAPERPLGSWGCPEPLPARLGEPRPGGQRFAWSNTEPAPPWLPLSLTAPASSSVARTSQCLPAARMGSGHWRTTRMGPPALCVLGAAPPLLGPRPHCPPAAPALLSWASSTLPARGPCPPLVGLAHTARPRPGQALFSQLLAGSSLPVDEDRVKLFRWWPVPGL